MSIHKRPLMTTDGLRHEGALGRGKLGGEDIGRRLPGGGRSPFQASGKGQTAACEALVSSCGRSVFLSDGLGLVPLGNELWGNLLSDYVCPSQTA
jgi:hypothetical protein